MTKSIVSAFVAAALTASSPALAQVAPGVAASPKHAVKAPKSRADVQAAVARHFARMDANRDGFVTQAEAEAAEAKRSERSEKRAINRDPATIFARLDGNKDGTITRAEADAARTAHVVAKGKPATAHAVAYGNLFERADGNRDGTISRAEFDAAPPTSGMHGMHGGKRAGEKAGTRHGGTKHGPGGRMFAMGDANKDGRMSLAEAQQAALVRFDRSDLNRDGTVTPEESRQGREQRRKQRQPG